jgi:23S rRNA (adenine-N6)-dimethyltransferase
MLDIKYSQNRYRNEKELENIISGLNISKEDTVLDIGAGNGNISKILSKYCKEVIAYELDEEKYSELEEEVKGYENIMVLKRNFLESGLPKKSFKIFSNIPFFDTTEIIKKLTKSGSKLDEAYLFVQREAGERYEGRPVNTQTATILNGRYTVYVFKELYREDFKPVPDIDIVILRIKRKENILSDFNLYSDLVTYIFNQMNSDVLDTFKKIFTFNQLGYIKKELKKNEWNIPSDISKEYYLEIFNQFVKNDEKYISKVRGYYQRHLKMHEGIQVIRKRR